jgi:6-phosphofructokinase 1
MNISILFLVGGNGTMRAASAVQAEIERRRLRIAVVGIPKTIDNDISFVSRSFGFDTAVEKAAEAIRCARVESTGAKNGIGIVKVMGRESGFIAAQAAMAAKEANFVLVPEDPFQLHGPHGFLAALEARILARSHAVVVLSEGAGQDLCGPTGRTDASGNLVLCDIGDLLVRETKKFLSGRGIPHTIKFIDPSYIIRSVPANSYDRVYCGFLGRHAVHAGLAGKTGMVVSNLQEHIVHLPLHLVTRPRRRIRIDSNYWQAVLETTGQPPIMRDPADCPV